MGRPSPTADPRGAGIPAGLRALLACPACHGELTDAPGDSSLDCSPCGFRFPVRDGIPVMLVDQATRASL